MTMPVLRALAMKRVKSPGHARVTKSRALLALAMKHAKSPGHAWTTASRHVLAPVNQKSAAARGRTISIDLLAAATKPQAHARVRPKANASQRRAVCAMTSALRERVRNAVHLHAMSSARVGAMKLHVVTRAATNGHAVRRARAAKIASSRAASHAMRKAVRARATRSRQPRRRHDRFAPYRASKTTLSSRRIAPPAAAPSAATAPNANAPLAPVSARATVSACAKLSASAADERGRRLAHRPFAS